MTHEPPSDCLTRFASPGPEWRFFRTVKNANGQVVDVQFVRKDDPSYPMVEKGGWALSAEGAERKEEQP